MGFTKDGKPFDIFARAHKAERLLCNELNKTLIENDLPLFVDWTLSEHRTEGKFANSDAKLYLLDMDGKQKTYVSDLELEMVCHKGYENGGIRNSGWALTHGILQRKLNKMIECRTSGILFYAETGKHTTFYTPQLFRDFDASKIFTEKYPVQGFAKNGEQDFSYKATWEVFDTLVNAGYIIIDDLAKAMLKIMESVND